MGTVRARGGSLVCSGLWGTAEWMAKSLSAGKPQFKSQHGRCLAAWLLASYWNALSLSFKVFYSGIPANLHFTFIVHIKHNNVCEKGHLIWLLVQGNCSTHADCGLELLTWRVITGGWTEGETTSESILSLMLINKWEVPVTAVEGLADGRWWSRIRALIWN